MQVQNGDATHVTHGEKPLKADGTMIGKRLAALIAIRDAARKTLNRAYDSFVFQYGPINKTTLSAKEDSTTLRRMPNLVKFRSDPDAMLVMSEYRNFKRYCATVPLGMPPWAAEATSILPAGPAACQRLASPVGSRQATGPRRRARPGRVAGDGQPARLGLG